MDFFVWEGQLETRQFRGARQITGTFPYNTTATKAATGRIRKESFQSRAFGFAIDVEPTRSIDFLVGHDFGKPVASRRAGTLDITDADDAVRFTAMLPDEAATPTWVLDAEKAIANGTMTGLSPGFQVPPRTAVPNAVTEIPEAGNPSVYIRSSRAAVLREMSVVTNALYIEAAVELRDDSDSNAAILMPSEITLWL